MAEERNRVPEHILFQRTTWWLREPTTLCTYRKSTWNQNGITSGPAIGKAGDLVSAPTNLSPGDILLIDEIRRLHKPVEEVLQPAMESAFSISSSEKVRRLELSNLDLPPFTLIAATTRLALISSTSICFSGGVHRFEFYAYKRWNEKSSKGNLLEVRSRWRSCRRNSKTCKDLHLELQTIFLKRARDYALKFRKSQSKRKRKKALLNF